MPVGPSMASTPAEPISKAGEVSLQATPTGGEKTNVDAESPLTAIDLVKQGNADKWTRVQGVRVPIKPPPPGPEGE